MFKHGMAWSHRVTVLGVVCGVCRRIWIRLARDLNDRCCLKVYFTDVNKKGVLKYKTNNETVQTTQTDK